MKIEFKRERTWIELLPTLAISWYSGIDIYFGWLMWNLYIKL